MFSCTRDSLIVNFLIFLNIFIFSKSNAHKYINNECAFGKYQSPIRISVHRTVSLAIPAIERVRYENLLPEPLHISNNGHTVIIHPHENSFDMPYIFGGLLLDEYVLCDIHFHWGARDKRGSEHIINGLRYAVEMHLVHRNRRYNDMNEAKKHRDGLVVLGVFFQAGFNPNPSLEPILKELKKLNSILKFTGIFTQSFQLSTLLPDLNNFYTYRGSLTSPPCSESVSWFLAANTVPISYDQLKIFRKVKYGNTTIVDNFRPVQPTRKRNVILRKVGPLNITAISQYEIPWLWRNP